MRIRDPLVVRLLVTATLLAPLALPRAASAQVGSLAGLRIGQHIDSAPYRTQRWPLPSMDFPPVTLEEEERNRETLRACGREGFRILDPEFKEIGGGLYREKIVHIFVMEDVDLNYLETCGLGKRFVAKYGQPKSISAYGIDREPLKLTSMDDCTGIDHANIFFEWGLMGTSDRTTLHVQVSRDSYSLSLYGAGGSFRYIDIDSRCLEEEEMRRDAEVVNQIKIPD